MVQHRGSANRREAYVSRNNGKAVESLLELPSMKSCQPIGGSSKSPSCREGLFSGTPIHTPASPIPYRAYAGWFSGLPRRVLLGNSGFGIVRSRSQIPTQPRPYSYTMTACLTVKELHVQGVVLRTSARCQTVEAYLLKSCVDRLELKGYPCSWPRMCPRR